MLRENEKECFLGGVCLRKSTAFLLSKMLCVKKAVPVVNAGATQVIGLQSGMLSGPRDQLLFHRHVNSIFLV